jgi:hypothetical protein
LIKGVAFLVESKRRLYEDAKPFHHQSLHLQHAIMDPLQKDIEEVQGASEEAMSTDSKVSNDPKYVEFEGLDDPTNPHGWPLRKR